MQVLTYTRSLCEALETDYRLCTVRSHRESINRGINVEYLQEQLNKIANGSYEYRVSYEIEEGRKYYKIIMIQSGSRSVHAFVDKQTGDVYKSASWKSPAKGVRYNLLDAVSREKCYRNANWSGRYLYLR
jgi:hypothetical protein